MSKGVGGYAVKVRDRPRGARCDARWRYLLPGGAI